MRARAEHVSYVEAPFLLLAPSRRRVKKQMPAPRTSDSALGAAEGHAHAQTRPRGRTGAVTTALDSARRAAWLIERRDQLIAQLPRRIRRARALSHDVRELIV